MEEEERVNVQLFVLMSLQSVTDASQRVERDVLAKLLRPKGLILLILEASESLSFLQLLEFNIKILDMFFPVILTEAEELYRQKRERRVTKFNREE